MIPRTTAFILSVLAAVTAEAGTLKSVRVGPHKTFDRIVFEFDAETAGYVTARDAQTVEILFRNTTTPPDFSLPQLPPGLLAVKTVDAYRVGTSDVAIEIKLVREVSPSELPLPGMPWRLAIDLAPKESQTQEAKPEYIPGDRPIQTKFAGDPEMKPPLDSKPTNPELPAASLQVSPDDQANAQAVLAHYHLTNGDTPQAREYAKAYYRLTGARLELPGVIDNPDELITEDRAAELSGQLARSKGFPAWAIVLLAIVCGVAGGIVGPTVTVWLKALQLPGKRQPQSPRQLQTEIEANLARLQETVKSEAAPKNLPNAEAVAQRAHVEAAEQLVNSTEVEAEVALKESMMDRRVKRVLELSRSGSSVADIAAELEMGQDEVKLVLDLNT